MSVKRLRLLLAFAGTTGGVFVFDQWTKQIFLSKPVQELIPFWLSTTQHQNHGLLANIPIPMSIILGMTGIISLFLLIAAKKEIQQEKSLLLVCAYSCILGGALGNLADRLHYGYVFDWILLFSRSIINIADIAIGFGICLWLIQNYLTSHPKNESGI